MFHSLNSKIRSIDMMNVYNSVRLFKHCEPLTTLTNMFHEVRPFLPFTVNTFLVELSRFNGGSLVTAAIVIVEGGFRYRYIYSLRHVYNLGWLCLDKWLVNRSTVVYDLNIPNNHLINRLYISGRPDRCVFMLYIVKRIKPNHVSFGFGDFNTNSLYRAELYT